MGNVGMDFKTWGEEFWSHCDSDMDPEVKALALASAIAGFIASFMIWEYKRFNGFSGFGNIKWAFIPKTALKHVLASDMLEGFTNADLYKRLKQGVN